MIRLPQVAVKWKRAASGGPFLDRSIARRDGRLESYVGKHSRGGRWQEVNEESSSKGKEVQCVPKPPEVNQ